MLMCGLVRSNFAFATGAPPRHWCARQRLVRGRAYWTLQGSGPHSPRAFLMISSATALGTSAYEWNSIEYDAWPEVLDLRSPTYPNISDNGTSASTTRSPPPPLTAWVRPRPQRRARR